MVKSDGGQKEKEGMGRGGRERTESLNETLKKAKQKM